jgi:hypothetical protein
LLIQLRTQILLKMQSGEWSLTNEPVNPEHDINPAEAAAYQRKKARRQAMSALKASRAAETVPDHTMIGRGFRQQEGLTEDEERQANVRQARYWALNRTDPVPDLQRCSWPRAVVRI